MPSITFVAPLVLSALIILPGLWYLLRATPPAPVRRAFGGMVFLEGLTSEKETPARTPWWLLLLRLAALGLVILALSGPIIGSLDDLDGEGDLLIVVDDSWPAAPGWRERQEIFARLALSPSAAERPVRVLTTAGTPTLSAEIALRDATDLIEGLIPQASLPNRQAALALLREAGIEPSHVAWVSDGLIGRRGSDRSFLDLLRAAQSVIVVRPPTQETHAITDLRADGDRLLVDVERLVGGNAPVEVAIAARDGSALTRVTVPFDDVPTGQEDRQVSSGTIDLPIALRNEMATLSIQSQQSAGATWLVDAGTRRVRTGIITSGTGSLLEGGFYLERALTDVAALSVGSLDDLVTPELGMLILDDIGTVRAEVALALEDWVRAGGMLVRFAGPNTANASTATAPVRSATYPVALRGGERAFGGALSWTEPQVLTSFPGDSPFADLLVDEPITVRRQVLARASSEPGYEVWAALDDGTPLVTAREVDAGRLVLFHVTATPGWSDLPVSGLFPQILARLAAMASGSEPPAPAETLPPYRLLDGFGRLTDPGGEAGVIEFGSDDMAEAAPGLYGTAESAFAVNTYTPQSPRLDPVNAARLPGNFVLRTGTQANASSLAVPLAVIAALLFVLDTLVGQLRRMRFFTKGAAALVCAAALPLIGYGGDAKAQNAQLRPDIDAKTIEAALAVRYGFIRTGDDALDRLTRQGLYGMIRETNRRTALEPGDPVAVDIERDELSVFPLLYWSLREGARIPSDSALAELERFMAGGGMLIIDTGDGERQTTAGTTPAGETLRQILLRMNIPPLEPLPEDHILKKSFYRLEDLHGRNTGGAVWVEASDALRESTDGVPSLLISGRDWISAWAVDENGRPLRPAGAGGERRREFAYRAGINIGMVALTGNYKGDQVHVQALLDRLGEE